MPKAKKFTDSLPELGRFTSIPTAIIDRSYLNESKTFLGKTWNFFFTRFIYLTLFLPLAIVDLLVAGALGFRYALGSFFVADELQEKRLGQQKKYATIFSKNLYALVAFLVGLFNPKLVAFYFTPEKTSENGITAGGSYYRDEHAEVLTPETPEEIQHIIRGAMENEVKIMPVGAGRSQGKQFLPEGGNKHVVLDMSKFNTVEIDSTKKTATVGAGARWIDIQKKANEHKLALKVMQASNVFSVGGSVGTNIHGWDHITGVLSNTILSMDIITPTGELRKNVTPEDPLFHQVAGGIGLFGTVVSVKLQLTDNELLKEVGTKVEIKDYVEHFRKNVDAKDNIRMHLYRLSLDPNGLLKTGVAVDYVREGDEVTRVVTPNVTEEAHQGTRFNQIMLNLARRLGWIRKKYFDSEAARLLANNSPAMSINEIMRPPVNALFNPSVSEAEWLQEFFLPGESLSEFLEKLGQLLMDNKVILLNASVRFVKQHDKSPLSYAHDGDRFAVVLCFNQSLAPDEIIKAKKWLRKAQNLAVEQGGTYYLPYQHVSSPEDFDKAYPHAQVAQQVKEEVDPHQVFTSGFYQKYMVPKPGKVNYFKELMQDEKRKKLFEGFLDNVLQRVDKEKLYHLLTEIMEYNDTHEEIYTELCKRLPEVMPSALSGFRRILNSLASIKEDLASQAKALLSNVTTINGLVEIGYPGRFVEGFKKNFKVVGNIAAVYEGQSVTDYIQTGFPRPYHQFAKLDYNKPNLSTLKDKSADVITCYVGLHHFPETELDHFLAEVRRVLRDGGQFLLVDHDVNDDPHSDSMTMAHMAHTIFNAVTGASVKEELQETRNFHSMSYWIQKLTEHGLSCGIDESVKHIRVGDPSLNRMISFVKKEPQLQNKHEAANEVLECVENPSPSNTPVVGHWRKATETISISEYKDTLFAREDTDSPSNDTAGLQLTRF
ncbi:FAD-binding protein [Legionella clemsonensis]|uniref:Putative decaprenylphosphoryl-beta-D-ribose oxidase n=1 Tax=Legionella clemsonensis TaxID=1867846 RepID=A0A222P1X3_9GAMM|nr:FAD-binding protein [Legionella clemsonensis]ASQ45837.1 putative decaprenylphosphoryl-beta-D-ribose oxidase [Legionella clemsonensis]